MTLPDVRGVGFGSRAPFAEAVAWVEAHVASLPSEIVASADAVGRVLTSGLTGTPWPAADRAALDGYAVRAADTIGASDYDPLPLGIAIPVALGDPMPPGTDAVIPFTSAAPAALRPGHSASNPSLHGAFAPRQPRVASVTALAPGRQSAGEAHDDRASREELERTATATGCLKPMLNALAAVARGAGVERAGAEGEAPEPGPLRQEAVALLALLGVATVQAVRRPRVALVIAGPKSGPDVLTPMLRSLVARDGGRAEATPLDEAQGADLILLAGRTGCGWDDDMPHRLTAAGGVLDLHGIAFRPGDTAGLGRLGGVPAVLLPGFPLAALSVYEALAGPAVRRLGGRSGVPAQVERQAVLDRKITSLIGCTDMVRVRLRDGRATPLGPADAGGLGRAAASDGWVIVPAGQEGYPAGAAVTVWCPA